MGRGWEVALLFALSMLETFSRRDFAMVLAGERKTPLGKELDRLLDRLRQDELVTRTGRGANAQFRITEKAARRFHESDPSVHWNRDWDGKWRVFIFDLPLGEHTERVRLWRHLTAARFGFLQRSVWIWPHNVEASLREMVEAEGIPESFCGFEVGRLFLCNTKNVVASAWNWKQIANDHSAYLKGAEGRLRALPNTHRVQGLTTIARVENESYRRALHFDPLLPLTLWPDGYQGPDVLAHHREILDRLRKGFARMPPS